MNRILGLTDQPKQRTTIVTADGVPATFVLEYRPNQLGWFYDLQWSDFSALGQRLPSSPNALRQYRNKLNWGLAILSKNNVEPTTQTVFIDGTTQVYLLDETDVLLVEAVVYPTYGSAATIPPEWVAILDQNGLAILDQNSGRILTPPI